VGKVREVGVRTGGSIADGAITNDVEKQIREEVWMWWEFCLGNYSLASFEEEGSWSYMEQREGKTTKPNASGNLTSYLPIASPVNL
jgi:hypothetical protein